MGICYIFGAMESAVAPQPQIGDLVIAADAGYANLNGVRPDVVVGDFDSLGYVPEHETVMRHPVHKNDTDMMLAVKCGLDRGYDRFVLIGGLGGRLDHTVANFHVLAYLAAHGAKGCLLGTGESVLLLQNGRISFGADSTGTISVFAYGGPAQGVTLEGLEYPLDGAALTSEFPLGVSNAFQGVSARISVASGRLLIIWSGGIDTTDFFAV